MDIPGGIFKSYDIRGIYPDEINEENIVPIVRAIYKFFLDSAGKNSLKIVLGRDMRISSPSLFEKASQALVEAGAEVIDIGLSSTPTFYFAVLNYSYDGGIQISASHNPKEYNGLKIVRRTSDGILKIGANTGMHEIKKLALEGVDFGPVEKGKITKHDGVLADEVQNSLNISHHPQIKPFKVVADPANAMGALYLMQLFKEIGGELVKMNFELDGTFPVHQPDPLQFDTLKDLQKRVVSEGANLGLAPDGDADRLYFIDEKGGIVLPSSITSLVARELLQQGMGGKILVDLKYVFTPKKNVEDFGGELVVCKTGHSNITEAMHKNAGLFAGEASGHFYWGATGGAESPMPVILMILSMMSKTGKPLSALAQEVRTSDESGEINYKVQNASEIMEKLKEHYHDGEFSDLDGIAINYPDWRFSLRSSNTEPLLRLNIEAHKGMDVNVKRKEIVELIEKHAVTEPLQK
ncbi:MAG: phosphomannomutase/phosphoglucomutase [Patescibacteria group bacterium]|nr:phosphomannomutase/phosphoglucomutase [Patescibacteria group bacterium]